MSLVTAQGASAYTAPVAAFGLPVTPRPIASAPLDRAAWETLVDDAIVRHVTGHLVAALDAGAFAATDEQRQSAIDAHREALAIDLLLERRLVGTVQRLRAAGIDVRALKGAAFAHTVYLDPALRSYGDVDILVRGEQYDDAIGVLRGMGGRARYAEPRPGFTRTFGKGVCVEIADDEIDVHRTFVAGPFGIALDASALFDAPQPFSIAGVELLALSPIDQFLHACYHAALGAREPTIVASRDVAQMLLVNGVGHDNALARAATWNGQAVVQRAVLGAWEQLGIDAPHPLLDWARSYEPSRFEQRALAAYVSEHRSYATQALAGLGAVRGVRARASYLYAMALPVPSYARERGGHLARWRRGATTARHVEVPT
jgi:hypothetical protein